MFPARFDYSAPGTLEEAVDLLSRLGPKARPLAGGQSLIPLMRFRLARPAHLVDLRRLPILGIEEADGALSIGAMTTQAAIEASGAIRARYQLLWDAAHVVGDPLVRNLGTVGGSAAHADPRGDWGAVLLASRATFVVVGPEGEREIPADEFFTGSFETALGGGELLTWIRIPIPDRSGGAYLKLRRKVGDFATVGVAVQLTLDQSGAIDDCGIGVTGVDVSYVRAAKAEEYLRGERLDRARLRRASEIASEETHPLSDQRGSAEYKRDLVRVFSARALSTAFRRARSRVRDGSNATPGIVSTP